MARPEKRNEACQPAESITSRMAGTTTAPPSEKPVPKMLSAMPRRRANHLEMSAWKGMKNIIWRKAPLIAEKAYHCQSSLLVASSA